jgi:hypothetical protein
MTNGSEISWSSLYLTVLALRLAHTNEVGSLKVNRGYSAVQATVVPGINPPVTATNPSDVFLLAISWLMIGVKVAEGTRETC